VTSQKLLKDSIGQIILTLNRFGYASNDEAKFGYDLFDTYLSQLKSHECDEIIRILRSTLNGAKI